MAIVVSNPLSNIPMLGGINFIPSATHWSFSGTNNTKPQDMRTTTQKSVFLINNQMVSNKLLAIISSFDLMSIKV